MWICVDHCLLKMKGLFKMLEAGADAGVASVEHFGWCTEVVDCCGGERNLEK